MRLLHRMLLATTLVATPLLLVCPAQAAPTPRSHLPGADAHPTTTEGGYRTGRPAGATGPSDNTGAPVKPKVTARMAGRAVPTNDWWSSLIWQRYPANPYSENLYAHPLSFHAYRHGLGVGYPTTPTISADGRMYEYAHRDDLFLGVDGLSAPRTEVDGWSDWTVSPRWTDGSRDFRATIGHGLPYVYAEAPSGTARVGFNAPATVWHRGGSVLGVTVGGHDYALFAPTATPWSLSAGAATTTGRYFSVAVLPSRTALPLFTTHAYSFVTDTKVSWTVDRAVTTAFTATTTAREGANAGPLLALYRHQWRASTDRMTTYRYTSPRGELRLREGSSFTTRAAFNGVLPALPLAPDADRARLRAGIAAVLAEADPFKGAADTYWTGKALWRLAALVPIANQLGDVAARDRLLTLLRTRLTDWFTAAPGETGRLFAYDTVWRTLIGYPAAFGSDTELNDHHFHYGYFVLAAAIVAQHDPAWAARYGGTVKLLIKDVANTDRSDSQFPFLRTFDPYAGHSWASGHAGFAAGNNQESSSEAMMFATGAVLFGAATGDQALRDTGAYLYATEQAAIGDYWFDASRAVFPTAFAHGTLGILWGAGGAYATWWTANPEEIHGINMLPITGGSLYHAAWKPDVLANIAELRASNGGPETEWTDIIWSFLAIADPAQALSRYGRGVEPEWGESRAHTYQWLTSLRAYGTPDPSVTANIRTHAVLRAGGRRTYVAHNDGSWPVVARFSDGATLTVPARSTAWRGPTSSGIDRVSR